MDIILSKETCGKKVLCIKDLVHEETLRTVASKEELVNEDFARILCKTQEINLDEYFKVLDYDMDKVINVIRELTYGTHCPHNIKVSSCKKEPWKCRIKFFVMFSADPKTRLIPSVNVCVTVPNYMIDYCPAEKKG